jgi:hypothetical protein
MKGWRDISVASNHSYVRHTVHIRSIYSKRHNIKINTVHKDSHCSLTF